MIVTSIVVSYPSERSKSCTQGEIKDGDDDVAFHFQHNRKNEIAGYFYPIALSNVDFF